ncbi:trehalose-6-phosphate synthase [Candidatus Nomurabacteria bacterium]|nr:trehalose-6-phosphate synthase [Candidatus Nomurabacteria bacterium]
MRYIFAIIGSVILAVTLVSFFLSFRQVNEERTTLTVNLEQRAILLADSLKESVEPTYTNYSGSTLKSLLQKTVDKFANRERLAGIALYDNQGTLLATSSGLPKTIVENNVSVSGAMDSNKSRTSFLVADGESRYVFIDPLHGNEGKILGALMIVQNAGYIDAAIGEIWKGNLIRLISQIVIFSITIFIILRFFVFRQVIRLVDSIKKIRMGGLSETLKEVDKYSFFSPLAKEITHITKSLSQARSSASEEARMRLEKLDSPWTAERLKEFVKAYLKDRKIFVVSNREPYIHNRVKNEIKYLVPAHGMVTAVESVMEACGGLWIAHGSGNADKETSDKNGKIKVPPEEPKYTLKRVWLNPEEVQGHYIGFSNEALFPLCLMSNTRPVFRKEDWLMYKQVNGKFAESLLKEIRNVSQPIVLVQDLHFALLPSIIKKSRPDAQVGLFWHHPWPSPEQFSICPWRNEIIKGMLGADVIGFHIQQHCNNFLETVGQEIESIIDFERFSVTHNGHTTIIRPFPISVALTNDTPQKEDEKNTKPFRSFGIKTEFIGLGVDRLDYTKGILERFRGIEYFLDTYPEYKEKFSFLQIAAPSREGAQKYRDYAESVQLEAERINKKLATSDWMPIIFEKKHHSHAELTPLYRAANFCLITSLHDGMNLVSKEFIAARNDEQGVLLLSELTGAAKSLKEAIQFNPYNVSEIGEAIKRALEMPPSEQHLRMKTLRGRVKDYNVYRWAAEFIKVVANLG